MMHKAWSSMEEVPYCFWRSSVKFQGHIALKIVKFDSNWGFPDCNSSLNSPMAMKCCTKLETAKKRCPIVFQGHPSNFKVTRDKTSPILTQIGRFRTIGRSQLSNPSDLPCLPCLATLLFAYFIYEFNFNANVDYWTEHCVNLSNTMKLWKNPDSKVHGAHLGPVSPRWAPCWPHEPCYQGNICSDIPVHHLVTKVFKNGKKKQIRHQFHMANEVYVFIYHQ